MYLVFGGDTYYARGGGNDFLYETNYIENAKASAEGYIGTRIELAHIRIDIAWTHIWDTERSEIVERFGTRPYGDDPEDAPEADRV